MKKNIKSFLRGLVKLNKKHLIWIIPLCLFIGYVIGYVGGVYAFADESQIYNLCKLLVGS